MTTHDYRHLFYSLLIVAGLSLTSIANAISKPTTLPLINLTIGSQSFSTEVANDDAARTLGLSNRLSLEPNHAMLFAFAQPNQVTFWMLQMHFPLDIIWLDNDKHVLGLMANAEICIGDNPCTLNTALSDANTCQPGLAQSQCPLLQSPNGTRYVLEVPGGTAEKLRLMKGSPVHFDLPNA